MKGTSDRGYLYLFPCILYLPAKDWGLRDQLRRAAVSIPLNIAEGYGHYRVADFKRFLTIANASAYEIHSQVQLAGRLGYVGALETEMIVKNSEEISRMLVGLRKRVERQV